MNDKNEMRKLINLVEGDVVDFRKVGAEQWLRNLAGPVSDEEKYKRALKTQKGENPDVPSKWELFTTVKDMVHTASNYSEDFDHRNLPNEKLLTKVSNFEDHGDYFEMKVNFPVAEWGPIELYLDDIEEWIEGKMEGNVTMLNKNPSGNEDRELIITGPLT